MEQSKHTWDSASKKVLNEAGLEKAPEDVMTNIMAAIATAGIHHIKYKPLISKKTLLLALLGFVALFVILIFSVPIEKYYMDGVDLTIGERFTAVLGSIKFSKTVLYGVGFLGLFLIQIPFLKRMLDN
ncbi:MAG: hypothetical protein ABJM06_04340 [Gilvibacter sp.]